MQTPLVKIIMVSWCTDVALLSSIYGCSSVDLEQKIRNWREVLGM